MLPTPALGSRFRRAPVPYVSIMYKFLAPLLSAQLTTAPVGSPRVMRNLVPAGPALAKISTMSIQSKAMTLKTQNSRAYCHMYCNCIASIRGHRSAHSFATGPVIAEPFVSHHHPCVIWTSNSGALHLPLSPLRYPRSTRTLHLGAAMLSVGEPRQKASFSCASPASPS